VSTDIATQPRTLEDDLDDLLTILDTILAAEASPAAVETIDDIGRASAEYRRGEREDRSELRRLLSEGDDATARTVARALTTRFMLANLAEERQRVRALRMASQDGPVPDGIAAGIQSLADNGAAPADVQSILSDVFIEPTFTAHPTEARRKTVKTKLRQIASLLRRLDEQAMTDHEHSEALQSLEAEIMSLWNTRYVREQKPDPIDEARNVQWYLTNTLFDAVGDVYEAIETSLEQTYGSTENRPVPPVFGFRSWAGSDRDGNPFVTPAVTRETLERQRELALEAYEGHIDELLSVLSHDASRIDTSDAFDVRLAIDRDELPEMAATASDRYPNEPYRQKLLLVAERLDRVIDGRPGGYESPSAFHDDLRTIAESLRAHGHERIARRHIDPLARSVETFGFSLASLDLRDHRENHTEAVTAVLETEDVDYAALDEPERVEVLTDRILNGSDLDLREIIARTDPSDPVRRVLTRFLALAGWQSEYGEDAIDTYCISMCEEPSHVLEVLYLASLVDVVDLPGHAGLDIVPLLETKYALSDARRIMGTLFENEAYAQALAQRGNTQEVMIGYSDSNKENGFLAANWSLYRNQRRLADICASHDIELLLFHGRGGSISRGGGPMNQAMLALPNESVTGAIKFTEQGEAIAEKYANPDIAERELEQMLNAQLRARYRALEHPEEQVPTTWTTAMETMAEAARTSYRDLLETDGFVEYYEQATPITVIEDLNMGSRPASRSGQRTVEDLRAIPWVFSWTQSRCIVPGWYGLGAGIEAYLEDGGSLETLKEMYQEWPFFRTTIDRAALSLARTEMEIGAEYAGLVDEELREQFFPRISAEHDRTAEHVQSVIDREAFIDREWLRDSLRRRNPYVDPLNLLQVQLLDREDRSEDAQRALRLTVKGIAAGMKNTG